MIKIFDCLKSEITTGSLKKIDYIVPKISQIINENNILQELNNNKLIVWNSDSDIKSIIKTKIEKYSLASFDINLICWLPNQKTSIYDHPYFGTIICLLYGKIEENVYDKKLNFIKTNIYSAPFVIYMDNSIGYHSIKCIDKAVTLHINSPAGFKPFLMSV